MEPIYEDLFKHVTFPEEIEDADRSSSGRSCMASSSYMGRRLCCMHGSLGGDLRKLRTTRIYVRC
jgi:hypothetical protein